MVPAHDTHVTCSVEVLLWSQSIRWRADPSSFLPLKSLLVRAGLLRGEAREPGNGLTQKKRKTFAKEFGHVRAFASIPLGEKGPLLLRSP